MAGLIPSDGPNNKEAKKQAERNTVTKFEKQINGTEKS